jgi:hypothetical protein
MYIVHLPSAGLLIVLQLKFYTPFEKLNTFSVGMKTVANNFTTVSL